MCIAACRSRGVKRDTRRDEAVDDRRPVGATAVAACEPADRPGTRRRSRTARISMCLPSTQRRVTWIPSKATASRGTKASRWGRSRRGSRRKSGPYGSGPSSATGCATLSRSTWPSAVSCVAAIRSGCASTMSSRAVGSPPVRSSCGGRPNERSSSRLPSPTSEVGTLIVISSRCAPGADSATCRCRSTRLKFPGVSRSPSSATRCIAGRL